MGAESALTGVCVAVGSLVAGYVEVRIRLERRRSDRRFGHRRSDD